MSKKFLYTVLKPLAFKEGISESSQNSLQFKQTLFTIVHTLHESKIKNKKKNSTIDGGLLDGSTRPKENNFVHRSILLVDYYYRSPE